MTVDRARLKASAALLVVAVLSALLIGVLHLDQHRQVDESAARLQQLGRAHQALALGFLHQTLDGDGRWNRTEGAARLQEAVAGYREVLARAGSAPLPAALPGQLRDFEQQLERARERAGGAPDADLRQSMHTLLASAAQLEEQARADLAVLSDRLEARLTGAVATAAVLLGVLGVATVRAGRARAATQAQLDESEQRFRQVVEQTGAGVAIVRGDRIEYVNPRAAQILGRPAAALVGMATEDCVAPEDRARLRAHTQRIVAGDTAVGPGEAFDALRPDGTRVPVELQGSIGQVQGQRVLIAVFHDLSRERRAERAARASEDNFRAIVAALDAGLLIFDAQGRLLDGNPAAERLIGVPLADLEPAFRQARPWPVCRLDGRLLSPHDMPLARVLASGEPVHDELLGYTRFDGSLAWLMTNVVPLHEADGRTLRGAVVSFSDITERKRVEDALARNRLDLEARVAARTTELEQALAARRDAERFLQEVADHQPALMAYTSRDRRLRFANAAYLRWHGLSPGEAIGRPIDSYMTPGDLEMLRPLVARVLEGESFSGPMEMTAADGRHAHFWAYRVPRRENGEVVGYYFFGTDITELWQAEQRLAGANAALRQAEELARLIADNVPGRVSYWDREGVCRFANRAYAEWHARSAADLIGRTKPEILGPEAAARSAEHVQAVLRGETQSFEQREPRPDAPPAHVWTQYVPDCRDGQVQGYFALAVDVTPLRLSEQRLLELNDALTLARDRALQASRAKSAFLANMSHEIRTPMNAIIGLTHLLQREVVAPSARERLGKVAAAAQHLLGLINDVLDLSKIEAGKLALENTDFDPRELVDRTALMVADRAREKGLVFELQAADLPPRLGGDPTRLSQALLNLLSNAVKFTEQGGIVLRVQAQRRPQGDWLLRFEVADTGPGIDADTRRRLFDAFEQADASTTRRHGGSGLGLAITRSLVQLMGGEVGVESEPGHGSRFWFTARASEPSGARARPAQPPAPAVGSAESVLARQHTGTRVLLAEDNLVNQEVALDLLRAVNLEVDVAANGREALAMVQAQRYALVLMDVQMPELDGLEATRALRATPAGRELPVLAMTANAFHEDRQACLAAGMNDHIAKPVEPEQLYATLLRWLPGGSVGPRPVVATAPVSASDFAGIDGLDADVGLRLVGLRPETLRHVLGRFVRVYGEGQPALDRLVAAGSAAEQQRVAHSLRGACASVGAWRAQQLAETLEQLCVRGAPAAEREQAAWAARRELVRLVGDLEPRLAGGTVAAG